MCFSNVTPRLLGHTRVTSYTIRISVVLPWPHMGQLCFFEVGRNPDIIKRHHLYQFLPDT